MPQGVEDIIIIPTDSTGKSPRVIRRIIGEKIVYSFIVELSNKDGEIIDPATEETLDSILKTVDLNIEPINKYLQVMITDTITKILLNSTFGRAMLDPQGRMLVKIDVAGTATPISTVTTVTTVTTLGTLTKITDFPYLGYDHEKALSQAGWETQRGRFAFS